MTAPASDARARAAAEGALEWEWEEEEEEEGGSIDEEPAGGAAAGGAPAGAAAEAAAAAAAAAEAASVVAIAALFPRGKERGVEKRKEARASFFSFLLRLSPRFFVILCERERESWVSFAGSLFRGFSLSLLCFRTKDHDDAPLPLRDDDDEGDSVFLPVLVADQRRRHGEQQARAKSSSGDGLVVEGNAETGDERRRCAPPLPLVFFPSSCRLDAENQ
jgi:hypothetical protein